MILAVLFAIFAVIGLLLMFLDFAAKSNSAAPSMYNSEVGRIGCGVFVVCGLIALAAWVSFKVAI